MITYVGQTLEIGKYRITVSTDENGGIVIHSPETILQVIVPDPAVQT